MSGFYMPTKKEIEDAFRRNLRREELELPIKKEVYDKEDKAKANRIARTRKKLGLKP